MELQLGRKYYKVFCILAWICLMRPSFGSIIKDSVKCTEGSVAADMDDCASYFQCIDDETVHLNCANGSYFEANNEICVVDEFSVCPTSRRLCFDGDIFEDLNDCMSYVKCIRGDLVRQRCPAGSYFNVISKNCRMSRTGSCAAPKEICLEGELQVDSEDCAGYLECLNGVLVKEKCPIGSYFEPIFKLCQVDENGVCSSSSRYLKCIDGEFVEEECPERTYYDSNLETCLVDNYGACVTNSSTCVEGIVEEDPKDCAGYTQCIRGKVEPLKCAFGRYFNGTQGECLVDEDEVCAKSRVDYDRDLEMFQYSQSTSEYLQENANTDSTVADFSTESSSADFNQFTDSNSYTDTESTTNDVPISTEGYTSDLQTTAISLQLTTLDGVHNLENNTGTCVYNNKLFIEGIREVNPQDCAGYIECFEGVATELKCDSGRYFNATQRNCSIDVDEVCLKSDKTIVLDLQTTTESTPNFTTSVDPFAKCRDGQLRLDPKNCAGFLRCVDGELKEEVCPSGFFYNSTSSKCMVDMRATCVTNIKFCIEGVREEDPNNCAGYRQCIRGVVQNLNCPLGQYFNVAERDCLMDVHKVCARTEEVYKSDEVQQNDTGTPLTKPDEFCIRDINGICIDPLAKCREGQLKMDPNNCAGYLKCQNGELIEELCPNGFYYDLELKICSVDRRGICVTNIQICDEGALEEDPHDCAGYRQCIGGQVENLKCPPGTYFYVPLRDCLIDVDEICVRPEYKYFEY
ncbi:GD21320 [Drosophila simulans]|uniref:GD21320 n=1 Tax=Drosophila simulans TaxID=7240 RepID=B4QWU7_DROSI|nr:GD21320 [Drosophila simulans]